MFIAKKKLQGASLFLLLLFVFLSVLPAAGTASYDELMKDGSVEEIAAAFKKDGDLHRAKIGAEKDTLLMRAIKYGRTESVLALLLKAGVSVSAKNKDGRTALMFACLHSEDSSAVRLLLKKSGSKRSIRKKLLQTDSLGMSALDYARLNPSPAALLAIEPYLTEQDLEKPAAGSESGAPSFLEQSAHAVFSPYSSADGGADSDSDAPTEEIPQAVPEPAGGGVLPEDDFSPDDGSAGGENAVPPAAAETDELPPVPGPAQDSAGGGLPEAAPAADSGRNAEFSAEPAAASVGGYERIYLYDYAPQDGGKLPDGADDPSFPLADIDNPNQTDAFGRTRLMQAVKAGNDWEIRSLLNSGADVNIADNDGWTALMYAVRYQNNAAVVDVLLEHGAKIKASNRYGSTPLQLAAVYTENPEILDRILAEYQSNSNDVFRAFVMAISSGSQNSLTQLAKIRLFLDRNVPVNRFYEGRTPLMYAAEFCTSTEVLGLLLDRGATPSIRAADGRRAFDYAAANANLAHDETYWALNAR